MELQYFGADCMRIITKKATIVVDDNLAKLGAKSITKSEDIVFVTNPSMVKVSEPGRMTVDQPGEYEVSNVSAQGVAARAHIDQEGTRAATIFKVVADDIRLVIIGHIYPDLNEDQLEAIGTVDIMVLPVGGNGYTLDAVGALKVIKKIEPKILIPVHYADKGMKYEVPQTELADALKELGMEPAETLPKLKLKGSELPETMQLIVLERQ